MIFLHRPCDPPAPRPRRRPGRWRSRRRGRGRGCEGDLQLLPFFRLDDDVRDLPVLLVRHHLDDASELRAVRRPRLEPDKTSLLQVVLQNSFYPDPDIPRARELTPAARPGPRPSCRGRGLGVALCPPRLRGETPFRATARTRRVHPRRIAPAGQNAYPHTRLLSPAMMSGVYGIRDDPWKPPCE